MSYCFLIGPVRLESTHISSAGDISCQSRSIFITSCRSCNIESEDKSRGRQELPCDHRLSIDTLSDAIFRTGLHSEGL